MAGLLDAPPFTPDALLLLGELHLDLGLVALAPLLADLALVLDDGVGKPLAEVDDALSLHHQLILPTEQTRQFVHGTDICKAITTSQGQCAGVSNCQMRTNVRADADRSSFPTPCTQGCKISRS